MSTNAPERVCTNHCIHPISSMRNGVCRHVMFNSMAHQDSQVTCNHRCTFSEPAKRPCSECGNEIAHDWSCIFNQNYIGYAGTDTPVADAERVPGPVLERHEFKGHADAPTTWCVIPDRTTEHGYCGQPKDAAVHQKDEATAKGLETRICDAIEEAMATSGVSRAELSRRLKMSRSAITHALRGDNNFCLSTLDKIADALDAEWHVELRTKNE